MGELIALSTAISWTACAMFAEVASKRMGSLPFNVLRMSMSLVMLAALLWLYTGVPYPQHADTETWLWLSASGLIGYVLGDFCLFNSYILIGSRFGQLFMTLAPPTAAIFGYILLKQQMSWLGIVGMVVTMSGIGISVFKDDMGSLSLRLPLRGVLYAIGAGMGQGLGLVLSAKGIQCYEESYIEANRELISSARCASCTINHLMFILPFAATAIRAITGLIGFTVWNAVKGKTHKVIEATHSLSTMLFATAATITGPFLGVSLSLMATQYTSAGVAQTIMAISPVLILLPSRIFFHQKITLREVLGAVISVCGVALFFI